MLQRLLLSEENELFDPARRRVDLSGGMMDHPLTDYFVASSHNSYLVGDQFRSNSDCRMYEQQLLMGCRCLEIDCWDGSGCTSDPNPNPSLELNPSPEPNLHPSPRAQPSSSPSPEPYQVPTASPPSTMA